ncbi:PBP1A family penicillin-binding protein [uncultured Eubacterium sp.]|uniref:transglycosylase domain-containing protein n=1 Tax=uncultured Eubacterium sp. TaxID=165185 RepID=UPI0025E4CECB|nr:PBP1A family penicillin-binding protein [uncultured Eubacterium sp.]
MNYGRKQAARKRWNLTSRGAVMRRKVKSLTLLIILLIFVIGLGYGGYRGYRYVEQMIAEAPDINEIDATPSGYMSTVLDANGNVTAQLVGTGSNRVYVTLNEIPVDLQYAFVAIEDERFYEHNGIDLRGIVRAAAKGLTTGHFSEGASTITQQLLKNNVFEGWTTEDSSQRVKRKLQEQYLAMELEKKVSKDWIMENYLNTINLGQNTLGVQAASRRYFGKDVSELNLSECAVIAGITQNPSKYNPISHPDNNAVRREKVLKNMKNQGYIDDAQYEAALADNVYDRIQENNTKWENSGTNITSYFVDSLTDEIIEDLQEELGYSEAQAYKALYSGGLTIYSTQDPKIQAVCDTQVNNDSNYDIRNKVSFSYALSIQQTDGAVEHFNEQSLLAYYKKQYENYNLNYSSESDAQDAIDGYREALLQDGGIVVGEKVIFTVQPQASVTIIDQSTGQVKALVGGRGEKTASKTLNRASGTTRQPGSTFKILTAYAPALESGKYTLATTVLDEPITYKSGQTVHNADGKYRGYTSIREAIQDSVNVVAIKTVEDITPQTGYEMAKKFGISTLTKDDAVESLPLGVGSVSNLELTAAFEVMPNQGVYKEPVLYTKILDQDGNLLLEKKPKKHRVIKDSTAFLLTSAMEDVVEKGSGKLADFETMPIAGKTGTAGTTEAARDAWFAGYTPYYTGVVWCGYDDNSELESNRSPKILWRNIMKSLHEGLEYKEFKQPDDVVESSVCQISGKLAIKGVCPKVTTEYFEEGTEPSEKCDLHQTAVICKDSGLLAGDYCPDSSKETKAFVKGASGADKMPTEVCNVHTGEGMLDQILDAVTSAVEQANSDHSEHSQNHQN